MNILVACEFSGRVRDAFRALGHTAISCDLVETEVPGPHFVGDVRDILGLGWDLMIGHPPCDHLATSGRRWFKDKAPEQAKALDFFEHLWNAPIPKICLENPVGIVSTRIHPATQYVEPWQFGHEEAKKTGLWLKNLPRLRPTKVMSRRAALVQGLGETKDRARRRSRTYLGIAQAMAEQWGQPTASRRAEA